MRAFVGKLTALPLLTVVALCGAMFATQTTAEGSAEKQIEKATTVLNEIMQAPDNGIPSDLLRKSVCVGVVPSEIKGALALAGHMAAVSWYAAKTAMVHGVRLRCSP